MKYEPHSRAGMSSRASIHLLLRKNIREEDGRVESTALLGTLLGSSVPRQG